MKFDASKINWKKVTITAIIIIVAVIAIRYSYIGIRNFIRNRKLNSDLQGSINYSNLSYTTDQYGVFAKKLYNAMDGVGTDEDAIWDTFKQMKNRDDLLFLIKTFGVRDGETLSEWLYDDLGNDDIEKLNTILSSLDIEYSF